MVNCYSLIVNHLQNLTGEKPVRKLSNILTGFSPVRYLIFIILILTQTNSFSSNTDSTKKKEPKIIPVVKYITQDDFNQTNTISELKNIDTALSGIEVFNPAFQKSYHYLGNLGTAAAPTIFSLNNH